MDVAHTAAETLHGLPAAETPSPQTMSPSPLPPLVDFMPLAVNAWLFPRSELNHTPSSEDDVPLQSELSARSKACGMIFSVGLSMKLPQVVLATACTYLHRFYMTRSLKDFQYREVAAIALWVATKVEEHTRRLDEFANYCACKALKQQSVGEKERDKWCNVVVYGEAALLEAICFDLVVEHPYIHLLMFIQKYKVPDQVAHAAWTFLNDSLRSPLCILYPPNTIAAAALHAAGIRVGVRGTVAPDHTEWWQLMGAPLADVEGAVAPCASEAVIMMVDEAQRFEKEAHTARRA